MKVDAYRQLFGRLSWVIVLMTGLLWPGISFAQADKGSQPTAEAPQQDQSPPSQAPPGKDDQKASDDSTTKLRIRVTGDKDQPIGNASVYVRFYTSGGFLRHEKLAEMNFKTNQDGSVKVPEIPQGKILIQVIAKGWHTYGKWFDIDKEEDTIPIKLDPPPHWY